MRLSVAFAFTMLLGACIPEVGEPQDTAAQTQASQMPRRDEPALRALIAQGVLREATNADVEAWREAVMRHAPRLGPYRAEYVHAALAYVVLQPLVVPPDMYGGHSRHFIVPAGVPAPVDSGSHNDYYFLETGTCTGTNPECDEIDAAQLPALTGVRFHCEVDHYAQRGLRPLAEGPARLSEVFCHQPPSTHFSESRLLVSPDGNRVARVYYPGTVSVAQLGRGEATWRPWAEDVEGGDILSAGAESVIWSGSGEMWAALQVRANRGGWAGGPMRLARLGGLGTHERTTLRGAPGRLDGVQWVSDGLAIAQFDMRGGYYRPEQPDPNPTLAMIDARRERVLDRLSRADIAALALGPAPGPSRSRLILGAVLADGRMRVVIPQADWIVWTQGEPPRVVRTTHETRGYNTLTPDGRSMLMTSMIQATGIICEHDPNCPAPTPVEGVWAALHDVETGRALWTMLGRAETFGGAEPPAISPDGRYALITMPPTGAEQVIALISLRDGAVLQRFVGWTKSYGFTRGGRVIWLEQGGLLAYYRLAP